MEPYKIRCSAFGHEKDVRGLCAAHFPAESFISCSRDITSRVWKPNELDQGFSEVHCMGGHSNFVSCVCMMPPDEKYPQGLIITGSHDHQICAYILDSPEPVFKLVGHADTVCCLAAGKFGSILSGSWDKTAKVWLNQKCVMTLEGHQAAIWAVAIMPEGGFMLTGSADKSIKLWRAGKCERTFTGHEDCVRGLAILTTTEFLSCSNDASIRRWLVTGECAQVYYGHSNYIYSISVMENGQDFVTSGEDRTIRVWKNGECDQTITLPAQSIWTVCALSNGDIAAGASDGVIRVFSRKVERQADEAEQQSFLDAVASSSIPSQIGDIKTDNLPGPEALFNPGKNDGQTIMIKDENKITAHTWNAAEGKWDKVGDVVGGSGSSTQTSGKQLFQGKEYDYVFDVEIEDGKPPLKLPYNIADDPYMAAHNFLEKNDLSQLFLDQVAKFIMDQCKGIQIGTGVQPGVSDPFTGGGRYIPGATSNAGGAAAGGSDPFTGAGRYIPSNGNTNGNAVPQGDPFTSAGSYKPGSTPDWKQTETNEYFPQKEYVFFKHSNPATVIGKVTEFNSSLPASQKLNETGLKNLEELMKNTSINAQHIDTLWNCLKWPEEKLFPILDILRLALQTQIVNEHFFNGGILQHLINYCASGNTANSVLALKAIVNGFSGTAGEKCLVSHREGVIAALINIKDTTNKNMQIAVASVLLNYAVAFRKTDDVEAKCQCLSAVAELIEGVKNGEANFRLLVCLGTTMTGDSNSIALAKSLGLGTPVESLKFCSDPSKVGSCAKCLFKLFGNVQ